MDQEQGLRESGSERPDRKFAATIAANTGRLLSARSLDNYDNPVFGNGLEDLVIESSPLKDCDWSTLHTYMHRRFGHGHMGTDNYKDLSAAWLLTTPNPEVFVKVLPSLNGPGFSFIPYVTKGIAEKRQPNGLSSDELDAIASAYRATLVDLLRPVSVRDSSFNVLGIVEGDSDLHEYDEENDLSPYGASYHSSAGYPLPTGLFGDDEFAELCSLLHHVGKGDYSVGKRAVIDMLRQGVLHELRQESLEVRMLFASACAWDKRITYLDQIGLSSAELTEAEAIGVAIRTAGAKSDIVVPDYDRDSITKAADMLDILSIRHNLADNIRSHAYWVRIDKEWKIMVDLVSGDFPENVLPEKDWVTNEFLKSVPDNMRKAGASDLADWAERLTSEEGGTSVLYTIMNHVADDMRKKREEAVSNPTP